MPCPLFLPGSLLPLSEIFAGSCAADRGAELSLDKLTRCCNPGYARGCCEPAAGAEADSFRFLVRSDDGAFIEIAWASEFNHHPLAVGTLRIARSLAPALTPLEHQARACAATYLHRTGQL
jgi:hypothetical protein